MTASAGSFSSVVRTPASLARRPLQASLGSAELAAHSAPSGLLVPGPVVPAHRLGESQFGSRLVRVVVRRRLLLHLTSFRCHGPRRAYVVGPPLAAAAR